MRIHLILAALMLGLACSCFGETQEKGPQSPPPTHAEVAYDKHERTKLDFWQAEGEGARPLLIYIHGGGWMKGDKRAMKQPEVYLNQGISVASINYRLLGTNPLPTPVHDAARAVQFLRSKAKEWNLDKNKVVVSGGSAGGCSSLWIACHDDLANPDSSDPVERESSRVQGAGVLSAQTSIDPMQIEPWIGPKVLFSMINKAVGEATIEEALKNYAKHESLFKEFSPINHLSKDDPPLFLEYDPRPEFMVLPATSFNHGIHHGLFGIKFKEKSAEVGHNKVELLIKDHDESKSYASADDFILKALLGGETTPAAEIQLAPVVKPSTIIPARSRLKKFMPSRHNEKLEQAKNGQIDLVMIGDSITHNWEGIGNYDATFAGRNLLNLGFAGDRTENVLWRLQHGAVDGISPKLVTLMIGTNNANKGDDPDDIAAGIKAIVEELRTRLPESKLIVFSIFPRKPGPESDRTEEVNGMLPKLADQKQVFHVDLNKNYLDEEGQLNPALYGRDRLHLSSQGYAAWAKALTPILDDAGVRKSAESVKAGKEEVSGEVAPVTGLRPLDKEWAGKINPATTLWFKQAAKGFDQSLVLGNGRVGAMVYGDADKERIVLNEESVWSGSRGENNIAGGHKYLPEMRRLLAEEKFDEANALKKKAFPTKGAPKYAKSISPFGRFQTLGNLLLTFSGNKEAVTDYRRELDLTTGLGTVSYKRGKASFTREHFVSAPDEVFVSRLSGPVSFAVEMDRAERFETKVVGERELVLSGHLNDGFDQDGLQYVGRLRVVGGTVKAEGNKLVVSSDEEVLLLFAAATDYRGIAGRQLSDPLAATTADLDKAEKKSFVQMRAAQKADHEKFFNRVTLTLPKTKNSKLPTDERMAAYRKGEADPSLAALFANMGRYLLISSSRPGGLPANLQGIWAEEVHTMWNGDYHFNINTQMNYWPALTCNLVEMQEPMNTFIASLVEPGSKTAKAYYNSPGWIAHRLTNIWGYTAPAGMDIGGPAWLCEHLWEQYAFTLDEEFLATVYPVMKGSVEFYLFNLFEEPENKWLVTGPSASPENGFNDPGGKGGSGICLGPTIDMQQLRELFGNVIRAAQILGVDEDLQQELSEKRPRLAPNQIAPDGVLQEWLKPYEEREPTHRHCSPLYGLYPYYEITPDGTPKMAGAARKLLERRGVGQSTGWSNAWRVNLWARMGDAEKSWEFAHRMLTDNCFDNMLSQFRPGKKKLFQIEANFGLTSGIVEMLMQSQPDSGAIDAKPIIRILPALPKAWPTGKVTGLLARDGVEVDIEWKDGELIDCQLRSAHDIALLKVSYDGATVGMSLKAGRTDKAFASKDSK